VIPAVAITAGKWLLGGNWKWAVPAAISAAAVVYAGAQRINYLGCKADRAQSIAAAEKAARDHLEADRRHGERLVGEYALEIAQLQEKYENAQNRLSRAASVAACGNSPAARAFDDGVSALDRETGRGDAPPAGRAGAAVPGSAAPAGRLR
jgi:hypothetical protein